MNRFIYFIVIFSCFSSVGCKKYLDKKQDLKLAIPTSLNDFQKLLDNPIITDNLTPGVLDLGTDDYFLAYSTYQNLAGTQKACYSWESDIWLGSSSTEWNTLYSTIYTCNVVLEGVNGFQIKDDQERIKRDLIIGHALFVRGMACYYLEESFGQPYRPSFSSSDLGIPLRLNSNLSIVPIRSTVEKVYGQITADLEKAIDLLPLTTSTKNRPSKASAYAGIARVYLTMQDYQKAGVAADNSLQIRSTLFDYNSVPNPLTNNNPFSNFSPPNDLSFESLYFSTTVNYNVIRQQTTNITPSLYNSYDTNDLRKYLFFFKNNTTGYFYFKGNYSGSTTQQFSAPAIDEMYLTRAECFARAGDKDKALLDLNTLLMKRWRNTVPYPPLIATNAEDALRIILSERRKELIFRGIRWIDLRRLNQDPRFAVTIIRDLNGQIYSLPPNDKRYTYPIPDDEIRLTGMPQNPR